MVAATLKQPVQLAYFVEDSAAAAEAMATLFGAGPFFLNRRIELAFGRHRGKPCPFVHTSAYGQWGDIMVELVQQDEEGASPFRDLYGPGETGLHHLAYLVAEPEATIRQCEAAGFPLATHARTLSGTDFYFVDACATLGHMLELYAPEPALTGFYRMVREAAQGWDGSDPVREL